MYISRSGSIQRCLTLVTFRNVHKIPGTEKGLKCLMFSKSPSIHRFCGYFYSSLHKRGYQHRSPRLSDTSSLDKHTSPSQTLALNSFVRQHISASFYSGITLLRLTPITSASENFQSQGYFQQKSHRNSHAKESNYRTLVQDLIRLLTGLGLSYLAYKIVTHIHGQPNIMPTAACLSQEPCLTQSVKLDTNSSKQSHPSSKTVLENSDQRKIGEDRNELGKISLVAAIEKTQKLCSRRKEEVGSPGIVVCVSVDGKQVYAEGFGHADVENQIPMKPSSVLRIASISKAITATIVAKAWEKGQIDLEKAVQHYVPSFPQKEFMGEKVEITVQQLLNHSSGIRHYKPKDDLVYAFDKPIADLVGVLKDVSLQSFYKTGPCQVKKPSENIKEQKAVLKDKQKKAEVSEMERGEYYLMKHYSTTTEALALFANDPLVARPGTRFVYTTFAYTLLAAVVESALKKSFTDIVMQTLSQMGLNETYLDLNDPIIYDRTRYYVKDAKGNIVNAPYVDNSYKWAGGGLLSTAEDIVKYGNILLYSAQHQDGDPGLPGFLKSSTILKFWTPQGIKGATHTYGLGFSIRPANELFGMCDHNGFGVGHTGAAIGASSALFILPRHYPAQKTGIVKDDNSQNNPSKISGGETTLQTVKDTSSTIVDSTSMCKTKSSSGSAVKEGTTGVPKRKMYDRARQPVAGQLPQGVVVCVMLNMISVSAKDVAEDIARTFENVDFAL